jgi:hypothetical protein
MNENEVMKNHTPGVRWWTLGNILALITAIIATISVIYNIMTYYHALGVYKETIPLSADSVVAGKRNYNDEVSNINDSMFLSYHKSELIGALKLLITKELKLKLPVSLSSFYYPSGWMGDGENGLSSLQVTMISETVNEQPTATYRIQYTPPQVSGNSFAGIFWQYPSGNWGETHGRCLLGANKISFYAKGERGNEIVDFQSGMETKEEKPYSDKYHLATGPKVLTKEWKHYEIDLTGQDLTDVIGPFAWVAPKPSDNRPIVTYIADLKIE